MQFIIVVVKVLIMKKQYISKKQVEHISQLAHIEITEEEKGLFTEQFNKILGYFKMIEDAAVDEYQPTYHILDLSNVYRIDKVTPSLTKKETLKNAPHHEKSFFKSPRII